MVLRLKKRIAKNEELIDLAQQFREIDNVTYFKISTEAAFEKNLQELLSEIGVLAIKLPDKTSELTLPDLLCHGVRETGEYLSFYIECKVRGKGASKKQKDVFPLLAVYVPVLICNDWEKVATLFDALGGNQCWPPTSLLVSS